VELREKIVLISPYPELSNLARRLAKEQGRDVEVYTAVLDKGVALARKMEAENAAVIISRGATGALIRAAVNIPLVQIEITSFDILEALYKAKQVSSKVAFFDYWFRRINYDFEKIKAIIGLPGLMLYYYQSEEELAGQIEAAAAGGCEVVVASGVCIINQAREKGMGGVMIDSSREAMQEALVRAQEVVAIRKKDRQLTERLKTIIDHSYGGIIAVDDDGRISHFNPSAEEALRVPRELLLGKSVRDLQEQRDLQRLLGDGQPSRGDLLQIRDRKYIVSRVPLKLEAENFGTVVTFQEVSKIQNLEARIRQKLYDDKGFTASFSFADIVGASARMEAARNKAIKYSQTEATVLITGESGTGKELFAQSIHRNSRRSQGPFVAINCAAIPENLLESELFGYEEGAFTGARKGGSLGLFEIAHGGTIFLDEILELPFALQAHLLRVLQEKAIRRVGGQQVIPVDIRILAASNREMLQAVREGKFREDLYFRLNVLNLNIPPLRERPEDIQELLGFFLDRHRRRGKGAVPPLSPSHEARLMAYSWPGNVRELESFVEKYVLLTAGEENTFQLTEELLSDLYMNDVEALPAGGGRSVTIPVGTLQEMEENIIRLLARDDSLEKGELARQLGISRTTLWKKLKE
jgi:transcriptional regulator with PAS, ATPase and Fis domain